MTPTNLEALRASLPEAAKDIKLNLQSVLEQSSLSPVQVWGVALASAIAAGNPALTSAISREAAARASREVADDAVAAASLMAMNNVYYRFRHFVKTPSYSEKPPRLRMNRILKPLGSKADFELMCLAVSAINGCESCVVSHEKAVLQAGLSEEQVHDAVRIASTVAAAAVALSVAENVAPTALGEGRAGLADSEVAP
jgi:alkyl hydroperoxide reductase subunit D